MLTTLNLKVGSILHDMEQNIDHTVALNMVLQDQLSTLTSLSIQFVKKYVLV